MSSLSGEEEAGLVEDLVDFVQETLWIRIAKTIHCPGGDLADLKVLVSVLKGVLSVADAVRAVALGVDGILVSNHGGRQLDAAPSPLEVLSPIKAAVGERAKILVDSGARTGADIAKALALGADFVLLGRAFQYGVAALGARGGDHVARILIDEMTNVMAQIGARTLTDLPGHLSS